MTTELCFFLYLGNATTWQPHAPSPICPSPLGASLMQAALLFVGVLTLIDFVHI
jgi:hypothetical protein